MATFRKLLTKATQLIGPEIMSLFFFRKFDPENQLVDISMELALNAVTFRKPLTKVIQLIDPEITYFLFRKFAHMGLAWQLCSKNGNDDASNDR